MSRGLFISALVACLVGFALGAIVVYRFYTGFIDEMLNVRYSTELAQDISSYSSIQQGDYSKVARQLKIRIASDVIGLKGQCEKLLPDQRIRAEELFQKLKKLGIDSSIIPGSGESGVQIESCTVSQ